MITFELNKDNDILEINLDKEGKQKLIKILNQLKQNDHLHLMTKDWGNGELSSEPQNMDNTVLNLVNIRVW